ncbi:MAG TPA: cytochrome c biogenesis heme-transporting ATPase CcmA [Steroidobacteraceae bacterium]|jgi:heme exporter protein A|nr:cytochrome c biogenesis heme-transporting ATPase CcmA [Steroidobacteraceae bacterium]
MPHEGLEAENLHLWRGERHVLNGVGFAVPTGACLHIAGANGSGKTTLLRTLCGLLYAESGRVLWDGQDVRDDMPAFHARLIYIGHEPPLKADLSALENLRFWVGVRRRRAAALLGAALERVGAAAWAERPVRTLSAGQKRRVALAALSLLAAPLWLLDEPTTNLDAEGQQLVGSLIGEQLARGGLVLAATHHELPVAAGRVRRLELAG